MLTHPEVYAKMVKDKTKKKEKTKKTKTSTECAVTVTTTNTTKTFVDPHYTHVNQSCSKIIDFLLSAWDQTEWSTNMKETPVLLRQFASLIHGRQDTWKQIHIIAMDKQTNEEQFMEKTIELIGSDHFNLIIGGWILTNPGAFNLISKRVNLLELIKDN
jgi:hypothetical protein